MREIQISIAGPRDDSVWSDYVARHPDATLFHTSAWKQAVSRAFGHRPHYLVARRGSDIAGFLPLIEINSLFGGRMLVSTPYATFGGAISDDAEIARRLLGFARQTAEDMQARCLEIRSRLAVDPDAPVRRTHATFMKELPSGADAVLDSFPRKTRAAARRAVDRYDLKTESGPHLLKTVWRLYARSMRRLGSPNYPFRFFRELVAALRTDVSCMVVTHCRRPVAGLLSFRHHETAMPYFVGVDEREDIYGLNNYLYWQSMCRAVNDGCRRYDFGRTRVDNSGPFEFKRSFGFEPTILEYQVLVAPGRTAPDLSPTSPRWAAARRLWKSLPLPVTRPLGAWLARSIPG